MQLLIRLIAWKTPRVRGKSNCSSWLHPKCWNEVKEVQFWFSLFPWRLFMWIMHAWLLQCGIYCITKYTIWYKHNITKSSSGDSILLLELTLTEDFFVCIYPLHAHFLMRVCMHMTLRSWEWNSRADSLHASSTEFSGANSQGSVLRLQPTSLLVCFLSHECRVCEAPSRGFPNTVRWFLFPQLKAGFEPKIQGERVICNILWHLK